MPRLRWEEVKVIAVVVAVLLVAGCSGGVAEPGGQETDVVIETTPSPATVAEPAQSTEPTAAAGITVSVSKMLYEIGEPVPITITNHLNRDIFYDIKVIRIEDGMRIRLVETITEEVIPPQRLAAGETVSGAWDQVRWWAPEKEGIERFRHFSAEIQVPPGPYQWGLMYGFTEEAAMRDPITVYSQVFTIAGDGEPRAGDDPVTVSVTKDVYQVGEVISYTIVNHSDQPIYYRYSGCGFPYIVQWVDDEEVTLAINITEEIPALLDIEPGGSLACSWDQTFHAIGGSDPDVQGHRYQVRFWYAFTEEDVDVQGGLVLMARSQVFTIE